MASVWNKTEISVGGVNRVNALSRHCNIILFGEFKIAFLKICTQCFSNSLKR